jgi:leucyl/phenylalanyl-tRNA--protein transferase
MASPRSDEPDETALERPDAQTLLWAYRRGIFPMARGRRGPIDWIEPTVRGVFDLEAFHVPRNLAREVRKGRFEIRSDTAFKRTMRECAVPRGAFNGSWMSRPLLEAYLELFELGHCHSVEAWRPTPEGDQLVGGLYGVHLGSAFFGESMFSRPELGGSNASKVCLVHLVERLRRQGFTLLDAQMRNPHLEQFGLQAVPRLQFQRMLRAALRGTAEWGP